MYRHAVGLAAVAVLAACDDQVQVEKANNFHADVRAIATQARGAGDILLVVTGADSLGSPEPVKNAVRDAIQGRPGSVNPSYTLAVGGACQDISTVPSVSIVASTALRTRLIRSCSS